MSRALPRPRPGFVYGTAALAIGLTALVAVPAVATAPAESGKHVDRTFAAGSVLVGFQPGVSKGEEHRLVASADAHEVGTMGVGVHQLKVRSGDEQRVVALLRANPSVRYAEPDFLSIPTGTPSDPGFPNQWAEQNVGQTVNGVTGTAGADADAVPAWAVTTGDPRIVVAEVDTGVDYTHPDLAANIWTNDGTIGGCAAGTHGYNVITGVCDPRDDDTTYAGHGTHVAGIIGAVGDNGIGVVGMNWHTTILPVKWIPSSGPGATSNLVRAIDWVLQAKAAGVNVRIVNDSNVFVGTAFSQALSDEIDLLRQNNVLFVTAAGSTGADNDDPAYRRYPCGYARSNEICATWSNQSDRLPSGANFGRSTVDLAAPGDNIYSTLRGGTYGYVSGGSMAAAAVSGAAALVLAAQDMDAMQLKADLLEHAKPLASLSGKVRTGGRLDVCAAVPGCGASGTTYTATLGTTSIGASSASVPADRKAVNAYALPVDGTVSKLSMYLTPRKSGNQLIKGVVYADSSGRPGALRGATNPVTFSFGQKAGWYDLPFTTPLALGHGTYWIGFLGGARNGVAGFAWKSVTGARSSNRNVYTSGPSNPFGNGAVDDEQMSLFATYTSSQHLPFAITTPAIVLAQTQPAHPSPEPQVGQALSAGTGDWDFAPTDYTYQWSRCDATGRTCTAISGATSATYTPVTGDVGGTIRVTVTARSAIGTTPSESVPTLVVQAAPAANVFGKTAVGGTIDPADANWERLDVFNQPQAATVNKLTIYLHRYAAGGQALRGLLYADNGGVPGALLATTGDLTLDSSAVSGWYDLPFATGPALAAGNYWIGAQFGGTTRIFALRYDESTAGSGAVAPATFTGAPASGGWRIQAEQMSVYATYS